MIAFSSDRTSVFLQLTVMTLRITEECPYKIRHNKLLIECDRDHLHFVSDRLQ
ncbi:hypothetical protein [uncultured Nostoc sp.]|uniref:hypothetical protein n=1 Tax=uncultured Nostoc sp. TaxID=340711 RepID=UPI0035CBCD66